MFSHEQVWAAIDALAERYRLSPSGLARRAGLDPTAFNKSKRHGPEGRERWPSTESISKILDATNATVDEFLALIKSPHAESPPEIDPAPTHKITIPLIRFAPSGAGFAEDGSPTGEGWDVVEFPSGPERTPGVYALEVLGDGMMPLYRDGDLLIVEPGAEIRRGDRVLVKTREGVMAHVLHRQGPRAIEFASLNAAEPNRVFTPDEVEWLARIVWVSQ